MPESPRLILGLKLRNLRQKKGRTLSDVAAASGLSVSYLSEIEKGRKYPKPEKLVQLAEALNVPFDRLVSLQVAKELDPLKEAVGSPFLREFPFELFGLTAEDVVDVMASDPVKAGALIQTVLEIGRTYDVTVEHFLLAALRSYQQMHGNYFAELEAAAKQFRESQGWSAEGGLDPQLLRDCLVHEWGYEIDDTVLAGAPHLKGFRSVFREGEPPTLYLNARLLPSQKAFVLGREIGYRVLRLEERATSSSWIKVESFDQVLNNLKASYFSGALLIDRDLLVEDLSALFARSTWSSRAFVACMNRWQATPETFFTRLTQIVPKKFGLGEIFFLRFFCPEEQASFQLTKVLNMSRVPVPHGLGLNEHYCRRWPALQLLQAAPGKRAAKRPEIRVQKSAFLTEDKDFFVISMGRALALAQRGRSAVSLGFFVNQDFRDRVGFWSDRKIPTVQVNLTCERCALGATECSERGAPPTLVERHASEAARERALDSLLSG